MHTTPTIAVPPPRTLARDAVVMPAQPGRSWIFALRWMDALAPVTLSLAEQIATAIGDRIIGGECKPGARIIEQDVADEFQVSRGPVRDAFRILEREGLATLHRNRGLQVTQLSGTELHDIFEIRAALFCIVAQRLASMPPPRIVDQLDLLISELGVFLNDEDGDRYAETVFRIGLTMARAAGNPRLAEMVASLALQTLRYAKLGLRSRDRRASSIALWRATRDAIRAGDAALAASLAAQRIYESRDEVLRLIGAADAGAENRPS